MRNTVVGLLVTAGLMGGMTAPAFGWPTDINDEVMINNSGGGKTYQFQMWLQPSEWSNPRGGWDASRPYHTWTMEYAYALNGSAGNSSVCVTVWVDDLSGPQQTIAYQCGTNGASTGTATWGYGGNDKYVFAFNNSGSARTIKGGWRTCNSFGSHC